MRLQVNGQHPQPRQIRRAADALRQGRVIAYPTDSTYGIGCSSQDKKAIEEIYRIKQMPKGHPLTLLCPDLSDIARYAMVDNRAYRLMRKLVPGPFCFILNATREVPRALMRKRRQVGIRVPDHPVTQALLQELGHPLVNTSASRAEQPLIDPAEIDTAFPALELIVDADLGGTESSTILDLTVEEPVVVRQGIGDLAVVGL